jgi:glycosyltransferase involved in cell wall biosynthesis
MNPRLSVIIPCYGTCPDLDETLGSLRSAQLPGIEVILVDDGSPEPLAAKFGKLTAKYPELNLRGYRQTNGGPAKARNTALRHAAAATILPLDSDDAIESGNLREFLETLEAHPEVDIVYGDFQRFGERTDRGEAIPWEKTDLATRNGLVYCSLYRKALWEKIGGYNEVVPYGIEDWQFWIHAQTEGAKGKYLPKILLRYRVGSTTLTSVVQQNDLRFKAEIIRSLPKAYSWTQLQWAEEVVRNPELLSELELYRGSWSHQIGTMPNDALASLDCALLAMLRGDDKISNEWFVKAFAFDKNPQKLLELDTYSIALAEQLALQSHP